MNNKNYYLLPILLSLATALGMWAGLRLDVPIGQSGAETNAAHKLTEIINLIDNSYVDSSNLENISDAAIDEMLRQLDPYSSYIPAKELDHANEQLEGNFEGIGVEFNILMDTVTVVSPIPGGPSEKLGIKAGDKIVEIEGKSIAGTGIQNADVIGQLRGEKGSKVKVGIVRHGVNEVLIYEITRDEIPIYSVDASFMLKNDIGYIKVSRFAANTIAEFETGLMDLKSQGMQRLVLDLRGNPGGYLETAQRLAEEFLQKNDLIVYTKGKDRSLRNYESDGSGKFKDGRLVVLIDEGSASASEIVSGALQDLDRAMVVGRRSHGKGLVQESMMLSDGSAVRLTVARYYTPSGRCIQRPYDETAYGNRGHITANKVKPVDSTAFKTRNGRIVKEGGGIMPDITVEFDSSYINPSLNRMLAKGLFFEWASNYADKHRTQIEAFDSVEAFKNQFIMTDALWDDIKGFAVTQGIKIDDKELEASKEWCLNYCKALVARNIWRENAFFMVINDKDPVVERALKVFENNEFAEHGIK